MKHKREKKTRKIKFSNSIVDKFTPDVYALSYHG